jgi:hypothetical protein
MGTASDLYTRILNELKRPSLEAEARLAVNDAVSYYSSYRFWFLEATLEFATEAGTAVYLLPATLRETMDLEIDTGGGYWSMGKPWPYDRYRRAASDTTLQTGQPSNWAIWEASMHLYVAPDAEYDMRLTFLEDIGVPSDDVDNSWTNEAEPLIRTAAKIDLLTNVIRDQTGEAERLEPQRMRWLAALQKRQEAQGRPRGIVASSW